MQSQAMQRSQGLRQRPGAAPSRLHSACRGHRAFKPISPSHTTSTSQYNYNTTTPLLSGCRNPSTASRSPVATNAIPSELIGVALFFTPGLAALAYAYIKGKGNLKDGLSRLLTEVSQGYFQPNVGGENIPVAQGELSDLAGDEPLFKALYKW
jgi:hypothetical protein